MTPEQGDWPVGVKHGFTPDQVIAALNKAITPEKWEAAKASLRATEIPEEDADIDKDQVFPR